MPRNLTMEDPVYRAMWYTLLRSVTGSIPGSNEIELIPELIQAARDPAAFVGVAIERCRKDLDPCMFVSFVLASAAEYGDLRPARMMSPVERALLRMLGGPPSDCGPTPLPRRSLTGDEIDELEAIARREGGTTPGAP